MSPVLRFVLPALAAASTAYASCSASATTTIQNSGDASALASCTTFSGSIAIPTGATEDISLDGIQTLKGNLAVSDNSNIKRIGSTSLESIQGTWTLNGVTALAGLDFPKLNYVQEFAWTALPQLNQLGFTAQVTKSEKLSIENTGLTSLNGINLESVDEVFIANNQQVNAIEFQVKNISKAFTVADNNEEVNVTLANLESANNLTFRFCGSIDIPSLSSLDGALGLYNNKLSSFSAPNLTEIGDALAIVANDELTNLTFPALTTVKGNVQVANNTKLGEIDGLGKLKTINGALDLSGNITSVDMGLLDRVKGAFNLQSSEDITKACDSFQQLKDGKKIEGDYFCKGKLVDPSTEGNKDSNSKGGSKGAATSLNPHTGALGLAALAAVFLL